MQLLLTTLANAIIGFIVGACGVSGFLLPMCAAGAEGDAQLLQHHQPDVIQRGRVCRTDAPA